MKYYIWMYRVHQDKQIYLLLQHQLKKAGVIVNLRVMEWQAFLNMVVFPHEFDSVLLGWGLSPTPDPYLFWHKDSDKKGGFNLVGYGCTTCIGNSGPLPEKITDAIKKDNIYAVSVLSGNRNFEGRTSPLIKANYLASPPLVVAYALAGSMHFDLYKDALGKNSEGKDIYLKDIWP